MDHEIDNEKPSSKEGGEMKAGDFVWVKCKVIEPCENLMKVTGSGDENWFWASRNQCRRVEPSAIEACTETANDQLRQSLTDYPFGEPANSPKILDSSSDPMREAFGAEMVKRYRWKQDYFSRNENRYFDFFVEMLWQAFQAGSKYHPSPLAPSPCMEGVDADQFIDGIMEARGRASGFQVGDAVRFVSPGHKRHGTEGILKSIHHGPKNAYLFVSSCGQFHRYCTIAELERYDQADPIDIKGSMQSLDGADTIQAGDLQWTDRDGKYRLCNFTIGMRVHDAIQRGKAHGEKWVFYRKFKEAGE
jgi:hypothetical protein